MARLVDQSWEKIFKDCGFHNHNFSEKQAIITASQIKKSCQDFTKTGAKEVRILCKQDTREKRPKVFQDKGLFLLPIKNGIYAIIEGEGYMEIPTCTTKEDYVSKLEFQLDTAKVGDSEMQHLDFAYAASIIRSFMEDDKLILTIRGRKFTPRFSFKVGSHKIEAESVQTEVDAGYESDKQVVLVEAKNSTNTNTNTIIRQLYYPFRQWQYYTKKPVKTLFFEKKNKIYHLFLFEFKDVENYNSVQLVKSKSYQII